MAAFAADRPVIVFDQQGHGRTPDTPRAMSYEQFGDDAAALLHALEIEPCDVMGYSQGGAVALQLAVRHPQLCNKLVSVSATYRADGWYPSVARAIDGLTGDDFADTPIGKTFRRHTVDPRAFDAYIDKMKVRRGGGRDGNDLLGPAGPARRPSRDIAHLDLRCCAGPRTDDHRLPR